MGSSQDIDCFESSTSVYKRISNLKTRMGCGWVTSLSKWSHRVIAAPHQGSSSCKRRIHDGACELQSPCMPCGVFGSTQFRQTLRILRPPIPNSHSNSDPSRLSGIHALPCRTNWTLSLAKYQPLSLMSIDSTRGIHHLFPAMVRGRKGVERGWFLKHGASQSIGPGAEFVGVWILECELLGKVYRTGLYRKWSCIWLLYVYFGSWLIAHTTRSTPFNR